MTRAPARRWVTSADDGSTLSDVLERMGADDAAALAEGRVFVDGRRANRASQRLGPGALVEVHSRRAATSGVTILSERDGIVAVDKPPSLASEPEHGGIDATVGAALAEELGVQRGDLHVVGRLDVGVSGVMLLSRSPDAARRIEAARARGKLRRRYAAMVPRAPEPAAGVWDVAVDGRAARTAYRAVATAAGVEVLDHRGERRPIRPALLVVEPSTGRRHQIRWHAKAAGVPLLGDRRYGGAARMVDASGSVSDLGRVSLHSLLVELVDDERWRVEAPPPADLLDVWSRLGGDPDAWNDALLGEALR